MKSIEIIINNQKYILKGDDSEEHLKEVAEMVRRRVDSFKKKNTSLSLQKAAMLAAFDFASELIHSKKKNHDYRAQIVEKAHSILKRVESLNVNK